MIYKAKIQNGSRTIILEFSVECEFHSFKKAVLNCVSDELNIDKIIYQDQSDEIIFTATYLKNSLITYPKE